LLNELLNVIPWVPFKKVLLLFALPSSDTEADLTHSKNELIVYIIHLRVLTSY